MKTPVSTRKAKRAKSDTSHTGAFLKIHILNAGWGDSLVVELPDQKWGVIDCNCRGGNVDENHTVEFLKSRDVSRLEFVCLTHPDADHFSGMFHLIEEFEVAEFWHFHLAKNGSLKRLYSYIERDLSSIPKQFAGNPPPAGSHLHRLLISLEKKKPKIVNKPVQDGQDLYPPKITIEGTVASDQVHIRAIAPAAQMVHDYFNTLNSCFNDDGTFRTIKLPTINHNDLSIVLVVKYAGRRILLCGDIETRGWGLLIDRYGKSGDPDGVSVDAVKVSHHGSDTGTIDGLWDYLSSKGKPNSFITPSILHGLPDAKVVAEVAMSSNELWVCSRGALKRVLKLPELQEAFGVLGGTLLSDFIVDLAKVDRNELGICTLDVSPKGQLRCSGNGAAIRVQPASP